MFGKTYEDRLLAWVAFRQTLEYSIDPIQDVIDCYNIAPTVSIHTDAWDKTTWPDPWQLIQENQYCEFTRVLGMCYSLQLTDRFNGSQFEIHISTDYDKSTDYYILMVDKCAIGYYNDTHVSIDELPSSLVDQKIYRMPHRQ
jgi:hypothetical protein|tara:strand:- start:667 stop:1092 length:426 start_codon:yes stop_codon:yes gene_type:complete